MVLHVKTPGSGVSNPKKKLMSHVNDVINNRFKKGVQKQQKKEISKNKESQFYEITPLFSI